MPIFTAIATALLVEGASAFAIGTLAAVLEIGASVGISYAAKALAGNKPTDTQSSNAAFSGVQGTLQTSGDVPRSFNVGYSVTAGSLVYANTWGQTVLDANNTPNAYLTQVIALADLPGGTLQEVWVNGEKCTLGTPDATLGTPLTQYNKDGIDHAWVKFHDGTQTTADVLLTNLVSNADRQYQSSRVGTGVAYVIVTTLVNDTLWTGFPTFKFALSGIPLYDPSKDSTNGGSGSHRYSDSTTWGGDGDNFPAVQLYNLLRGFKYGGRWLYGLQNMTAARLPSVNWITQIAKCRSTITGVAGPEATYRSGGQISVDQQVVNTAEAILTACQGRLSEIGGFYKVHLGTPDSPSFTFTDYDILSTETQTFTPFFGLAASVNGITATYPDPAQGWNMVAAPPLYSSTFEAQDGSRRLLANPAFNFVPYAEQAQRLMSSALQEARRARQHALVMPPEFWIVEPGDVGTWTSARNGYTSKQFRVDGTVDKANLDAAWNITEVDPTDYDWVHSINYVAPTAGGTIILRPGPQGVVDWFAQAFILKDSAGVSRRPAIQLSWDGSQQGVDGIQYEVRLTVDASEVAKGRTDQLAAGAIIITQSLLPNTAYQVRGQYLPSAPRDMLWSDWLDVTTPDVRLSLAEFDAGVTYQVTILQDLFQSKMDELDQRMSSLVSKLGGQGWTDIKSVRSQLFATAGSASADIEEVRTVAVDAASAVADLETTVTAEFGTVNATISTQSTAIATLDGYAAAEYAVTLNVNGYATGFNLLNGGPGFSTFTIVADKFQVQLPGFNGNAPYSVFTTGNIGGTPSVGINGNLIVDGSIITQNINAGAITAVKMSAASVTFANAAIDAEAVRSLNIGDNAVTVPQFTIAGSDFTSGAGGSFTLADQITFSIDTTGLSGKTINVLVNYNTMITYGGSTTWSVGMVAGSSSGDPVLMQASGQTVLTPALGLTGVLSFTGTGGVVSKTVSVFAASSAAGFLTLKAGRNLWGVACKR